MISMDNHVKFVHFVLLADLYTFTWLEINYQFHLLSGHFFSVFFYKIKQLLDSIFVTFRIIKVSAFVIVDH